VCFIRRGREIALARFYKGKRSVRQQSRREGKGGKKKENAVYSLGGFRETSRRLRRRGKERRGSVASGHLPPGSPSDKREKRGKKKGGEELDQLYAISKSNSAGGKKRKEKKECGFPNWGLVRSRRDPREGGEKKREGFVPTDQHVSEQEGEGKRKKQCRWARLRELAIYP